MDRRNAISESRAKAIYQGIEPNTLIQYFKDDIASAKKIDATEMAGKGVLNNRISAHIMAKLETVGVPTHFIRSLNMREQLVRQVEMLPLEIIVRNTAQGEICERLGAKEGQIFTQPLVEFYYRNDSGEKTLVSEQHIMSFQWADPYELEEIVFQTLRINDFLSGLFSAIGIRLIDFKIEFGRLWGEHEELYIILADDLSPDNCCLWDDRTGKKLDKNRFPKEAGNIVEGYQEIAKRLGLIPQGGIIQDGNINQQAAEDLSEIETVTERRHLRSVKKASVSKPRV